MVAGCSPDPRLYSVVTFSPVSIRFAEQQESLQKVSKPVDGIPFGTNSIHGCWLPQPLLFLLLGFAGLSPHSRDADAQVFPQTFAGRRSRPAAVAAVKTKWRGSALRLRLTGSRPPSHWALVPTRAPWRATLVKLMDKRACGYKGLTGCRSL